ncbi:MAG: DEAD/DEAH box helicase family protein [Candidatus Nanohaloarchaea archaeon]
MREDTGFQSLSLQRKYRSGENDLLRDFYVPVLQETEEYDRAAGYFDTKALTAAANGISGLIDNDGEMRLLASPRLSEEDKKALQGEISETERSQIIADTLSSELNPDQFSSYLQRDRLLVIAWMVREGYLDIKIATLKDDEVTNPFSHYHEKLGVLDDKNNDKIAFSGSINETELAWTDNYESFDVFREWIEAEQPRVEDKQTAFNRLWKGEDPRVEVDPLPDVVEDQFKEISPPTRDGEPDLESYRNGEVDGSAKVQEGGDFTLRDYQEDAIDWWIDNNHRGIFSMATGTGKTFTALRAALLDADTRITVVVVPQTPLLSQWIEDIEEVFGNDIDILQCGGEEGRGWKSQILDKVDPYRISQDSIIRKRSKDVIITTIHSAVSEPFTRAMEGIPPERIQLIADEVHNYGASTFRRLFDIDAGRRIGLSATPEREMDPEGTEAILSYFGHNQFEYSTQDAIEEGYLAKYEYRPQICELRPHEYEEYAGLTEQINQISAQLSNKDEGSNVQELEEQLKRLSIERARIRKKAETKPQVFGNLLDQDIPTPAIIFCEDTEQVDEIKAELEKRGEDYEEYVSQLPDEDLQRAYHKFENDMIDYLLAIRCLDEGVDVPGCQTAILISSNKSERQFIQRRGRVLRKTAGKEKAVIYDILTFPGVNAEEGDHITRKVVEDEVERAKHLIQAAENERDVEKQLKQYLDPLGFGALVYT